MKLVFILAAIAIFGLLVTVHELGHFLAAKLCGVRVNEFSIGMGPLIWQKEKGDTQYSLRVLPIGGLKEKTMAALRSGITTVLIPKDNVRDLEEIDQTVRAALRFVPVSTVDQVFAAALCLESDPIREEVADHVAAFAPAGRESGRDAAVRQ